ncbi:YdbH domain-containing protein [Pokkaliibacter sp. CJK22405]|uniref:intermembrane phospholipid transport protein YdbH family protein n=1 Tax=Pokkaliibacter sp. CJK22405 TaxID=3384615 RepID=UPI003985218C
MQRLGYAALGLIFVLLGLYLTLPTTLPPLLDAWLQRAMPGWEIKGIKVNHPDLQHWYLDYLVLENGETRLTLNEVGITYAPPTLAQGYVEDVHVGSLQVESLSDTSDSTTTLVPPIAPRDWLSQLPTNHLRIDTLDVTNDKARLQGKLNLDAGIGGTFEGDINLSSMEAPLHLGLTLIDGDNAEVQLTDPQQIGNNANLALHWQPGDSGQQLIIDTTLKLHWVMPELNPEPMDGQLNAQLTLTPNNLAIVFASPSSLEWPFDTSSLGLELPPRTYLNAQISPNTEIQWQPGQPYPRLNGDINVQAQLPNQQDTQFIASIDEVSEKGLGGTLLASFPQWQLGSTWLQGVRAAIPWQLKSTPDGYLLSLEDSGQLSMDKLSSGAITSQASKLSWSEPLQLQWGPGQSLSMVPATLTLANQGIHLGQIGVAEHHWPLRLRQLRWQPDTPLSLNLTLPDQSVPLTLKGGTTLSTTLSADYLSVNDQQSYHLNLATAQSTASAAGTINGSSHQGKLRADLELNELKPLLGRAELHQLNGQLSWVGDYSFAPDLALNGRGQIKSSGEWSGYPAWQGLTANYTYKGNVDAGTLGFNARLPAYDLLATSNVYAQGSLSLQPERYHVVIEQLSADLLHGSARLNPMEFDWPGSITGELNLNQLSLQAMLATHPSSPVQGSGRVTGLLPFRYTPGTGLAIKAGNLSSTGDGGQLSYQGELGFEKLQQTYPQLGSVSTLLKDFRYDSMDASVDYQPDGSLVLGTHLSGRNPDFEDGRLVNFNINIEENLLQLLRSLQMTGKLDTVLGDRIRESLGESPPPSASQ